METNDVVMSGVQLKKLVARKVDPIIKEYDLRPVELDILIFLKNKTDIDTAKGIIEQKHLSKAHVSKSIENLRSGEFIKVIEDEQDHRIFRIRLTPKSDEVITKVAEIYEECKSVIERDIGQNELNIAKKVVLKMIRNINQELGE